MTILHYYCLQTLEIGDLNHIYFVRVKALPPFVGSIIRSQLVWPTTKPTARIFSCSLRSSKSAHRTYKTEQSMYILATLFHSKSDKSEDDIFKRCQKDNYEDIFPMLLRQIFRYIPAFYQKYPPYCSSLVLEGNLPWFVVSVHSSFSLIRPIDLCITRIKKWRYTF